LTSPGFDPFAITSITLAQPWKVMLLSSPELQSDEDLRLMPG